MTNAHLILATVFFGIIDLLLVAGVITWTLIEMGMM
jgi:hypothetical protein